ncbi:oxidoreductase, Gfo/Idh/MocA family protein [Listeria floridensis FSL S10-1187]|uniref:Oxidoreductase, Gfo/Idh/MocA family protein n=1 Tax=Listeria floridensis FSL S10-1187 TaxID=1265817 RepID=A0ABP3AWL2_9LIST|nr:Gfo/Idh/MocA family oxidoreductase [Listeria floridensis]EUJ30276.1 oxidoreductase, Gfo/Idh/MocA family protein [Listeria floridensis FSL S10-1187]
MKKIRLVIIGFGGMGSYHVELAGASKDVEILGAYDIDAVKQAEIKRRGLKAYADYEAVLADSEADAVLIATPNDVHKDLAIQALKAGKHVLSEKPVTIASAELEEILAVAEQTGKTFMVHQNRRWDEDFLMVRRMNREKTIGEIFQIESRVQGANGIPGDWRHLKAQGGGMLLDWGVHLLDQLLFMVDSKIASVSADLSYVLGDEVDDGFSSTIRFENGVTALIEVGTTNFIKLPRWYLKGTSGTAVIEDWDLSGSIVKMVDTAEKVQPVPIKAGQGLTKTMAPPHEDAVEQLELPKPDVLEQSLYDNFGDVILGKAEPMIQNKEVLRVLRLIEAIFKAAESNEVVKGFDK